MSVIPQTTELFIDGAWVDVTDKVRGNQAVSITRGRKNERNQVPPTNVQLTLDNTSGDFNGRYPTSPYFGKLGRNVKLRHTIRTGATLLDEFGRSVSNDWSGGSFTWTNSGGAAGDYDVNGTHGTHTHTSAGVAHYSTGTTSGPDMRVRAIVKLSAGTITGDSANVKVLGRFTDTSNWYSASVFFATDGDVSIVLVKSVSGVETTISDNVTTHAGYSGLFATYEFGIELYIEGPKLYAKVWDHSNHDEVHSWNVRAVDTSLTTGNGFGVRDRRGSFNTNSNLQFQYNEIKCVPGWLRCYVETPSFRQRFDSTLTDKIVSVQGAGIKRRLGQGNPRAQSAAYRATIREPTVVGYWPLEDVGSAPTSFLSPIEGCPPLRLRKSGSTVLRPIQWSSDRELLGSGALGSLNTENGVAGVEGSISVRPNPALGVAFWTKTDAPARDVSHGIFTQATLTLFLQGASVPRFTATLLQFPPGSSLASSASAGSMDIRGSSASNTGASINTVEAADQAYVDDWRHIYVRFSTSGSDVAVAVYLDGTSVATGTLASTTIGNVTGMRMGVFTQDTTTDQISRISFGHPVIMSGSTTDMDAAAVRLYSAGRGHDGELAGVRFARICTEEGIDYEIVGDSDDTATMGPQRALPPLDLLQEVEDVDGGIFFEPRHFFGASYRTLNDLYLSNQASPVTLNFASVHLSESLEDEDDDLLLRNDIEVSRPSGSSARAVQTTGPLNTSDPSDDPDGVGTYTDPRQANTELDQQLPDIAGWRRHLGTFDDQPRFPQVTIEPHRGVYVASPTLTASVARLDVGDYAVVEDPPSPPHPPDDLEFLTEGFVERTTNMTWKLSPYTTPAGRYRVTTYGSSAAAGRHREHQDCTLDIGIDSTDTEFNVTTNSGPRWITGSVNFNVMIGGELMTVTNIANFTLGRSTFTVTRSVNGVVKSHDASTPVHVHPRPVRALTGPDAVSSYTLANGELVRGQDTPRAVWVFAGSTGVFAVGTVTEDSTPVGVVFVAPTTGQVIIHHAGFMDQDAAGFAIQSFIVREGPVLSQGTEVFGASDFTGILLFNADPLQAGKAVLVEGLDPGRPYNCVLTYRRATAGNAEISRRILLARPVCPPGGLPGSIIEGWPLAVENVQDASDTSTSTSFTTADMTTCGVAFTAAPSGKALVHFSARIDHSTAAPGIVSFEVREGSSIGSGTVVLAASDDRRLENHNTNQSMAGATVPVTGLTAGASYNARLMHRTTSGTVTLENRRIIVEPVA
jgi:hypothetical protein